MSTLKTHWTLVPNKESLGRMPFHARKEHLKARRLAIENHPDYQNAFISESHARQVAATMGRELGFLVYAVETLGS